MYICTCVRCYKRPLYILVFDYNLIFLVFLFMSYFTYREGPPWPFPLLTSGEFRTTLVYCPFIPYFCKCTKYAYEFEGDTTIRLLAWSCFFRHLCSEFTFCQHVFPEYIMGAFQLTLRDYDRVHPLFFHDLLPIQCRFCSQRQRNCSGEIEERAQNVNVGSNAFLRKYVITHVFPRICPKLLLLSSFYTHKCLYKVHI